jgi:hypothetical protein
MLGIIVYSYNTQVHNYKQYHYSLLLVRVLTIFHVSCQPETQKRKKIKFIFRNQYVIILTELDVLFEFFILNLLLINRCNHYRRNFVLLNKAHNLYETLSHAIKPKHVPEFLNLCLHLQEILYISI